MFNMFAKVMSFVSRWMMFMSTVEGVDAHASTTTSASYKPAADVALASGDAQKFMAKLSAIQQAQLKEALPLVVWFFDAISERD